MMMRRRMGRPLLRTAAVAGGAYAVGHHMATNAAEDQYHEQEQDAQINSLADQQAAAPTQAAAAPVAAATTAPGGLSDDSLNQLERLGKLHETGVLSDAEFEAAKQKILQGV